MGNIFVICIGEDLTPLPFPPFSRLLAPRDPPFAIRFTKGC
jgi:hypothetical protein